jgi:class 3 adenylate cyclase/tetratricopeptide (TPR) repeat protein
MRCVTCGVELVAGKKFCHACGAAVGAACRGCGTALEASYRFCPDCGLKTEIEELDGPPPEVVDPLVRVLARRGAGAQGGVVATSSLVEGERKLVTVLFCDLVSSVAIAERLDPEEYHDLLDDYLDLVFPEIYRREGVVNVLAGDGLMALFGAPVAHEDSPERAVHAALAIREALAPLDARLRASHGIPLQIRIGVNTGPVVVGPVGNERKMDYTAIGDTTNLASRLQALAPPGGILISESTHRLVRGFFTVEPVGPLGVRGKSEPVTAYAVNDWRGPSSKFHLAEERGLTPFVGREGELARLLEAHARLAAGQLQAVAVVGDAGSGKSRLLYEFRRRVEGRELSFFEGRCASMLQALPYHPFITMMGRWFDLDWDESVDASAAKVAAQFGSTYEDVERTYPVLCRFLSLPIEQLAEQPADQLKRETFDAIARLVLAEAKTHPVVMIIEDLHWVDEPSRDMLDELVRRLEDAPVLIIVTHRPGVVAPWRVPTALTQIALRPLSDGDVAAVVQAVAGHRLPQELVRVIVSKAGGSPFFAEEIVRGLLEEGHLVPTATGGIALTRPLADLPIPGTVQEVIAARLDALGASAKRVVQVAAVLGRQFRTRQLAALLADDGVDVQRELAELERRGLVHRKTALSSDEFRFGESLTQEVAYEGLLLKQRRQLHERIGALIEAEPTERGLEHAALLAHHYSRGDDHGKAVRALLAAGHEAGLAPSYRVAAEYQRQAWELAESILGERDDDTYHRAALEAAHGLARLVVYFGVAEIDVAERAAIRGRELAEQLGDRERLASLTYLHGILTIMKPAPDFAGGLALAEQGVALAEADGLHELARGLSRGLCTNYAADGRFAVARERIEREIADLERSGHLETLSDVYLSARWVRDLVLYAQDEFDRVLESGRASFAMAEQANNRTMRSAIGNLLAPVHYLRGEYAEAKRWADITLEIGEAISNENAYTTGAALALVSRLRLGERVDPASYVARIETGLRAGGTMQLNTRFVGEALLEAGEVDRADRLTADLADRTGGRLRQALILTARGDVLMRLGRLEEAARRYGEAVALAEEIGSRSALATALLGAGEVALAQGRVPQGVDRVAALCAQLDMRHYRPRVERLQAAAGRAARSAAPAAAERT